MADAAKNPELLRSLGRLVRGLSALFWGLPFALIVSVQSAKTDWFPAFGVMPVAACALLLFGLLQLGDFQKQERPWRAALGKASLLALINLGLSPFLYWFSRMPDVLFFQVIIGVLAVSTLGFVFALNVVLLRLGAMLPDEALRQETRNATLLNRLLLLLLVLVAVVYFVVLHIPAGNNPGQNELLSIDVVIPAFDLRLGGEILLWLVMCLLVLLPLSMTMALIWKTKEVIMDSVFEPRR